MSFPESLAAALFLIAVAVASLIAVARAGDRRWAARRQEIAEQTPAHYQGRDPDFDSHGRPY